MPPPAESFAARLFLGPALRSQPDRRLVTLVREGYESAFEEIVRRYGRSLTRYAAAIVGSRGEDVTQDAFSKALLSLRRNDAEIELRPWLFRIVRNTALNDLRDSPPTPELLAEAIAGGDSPAEALERREELSDLMHRLRSLPEPQRAAIVMREMEGLSHEEIAAALGVSGGAARQAIHRARQALRNGAGMLVPLQLLKPLLAAGSMGGAEVAAGAGGTVGAGVAIKAVTATVLVAGALGAGVAVHDGRHSSDRPRQPAVAESASRSETAPPTAFAAPIATGGDDRAGRERGKDRRGRGTRESGDDRGHRANERDDDHGGHRGISEDGHSGGGPGSGDGGRASETSDHHGGQSGPSGGGDGDDSHSVGGSGGPGPSGGGGHGGESSGGGSSGSSGSSNSGSSGQTADSVGDHSSGGGSGDDLAIDSGSGSGGGPGPSEPFEPAETSGGSGSSGSGSDAGSGSGSSSGSSDDLSGGS
jgi:RNA polymerase sigma factor (sigma-70 family)